jgi:pimeloyl-ACP methyl ester carboxylesterase/DNA-binding CsgD family transcriptional regulator
METLAVHYVTTRDELSIAYAEVGEGQALVHVPNIFGNFTSDWSEVPFIRPWLHEFASRFRLVLYDGRGQGLSSRGLGRPVSMDDLLLDIEAVVERLGLKDIVLVAQGGVCHIAVHYALKHPHSVKALVLITPVVANPEWPSGIYQVLPRESWETFLYSVAGVGAEAEEARRRVERLMRAITQADFAARSVIPASDLSGVLAALKTPVLVLHPKGRRQMGPEGPAKFAAEVPNSRLALIEGETGYGDFQQGMGVIVEFLTGLDEQDAADSRALNSASGATRLAGEAPPAGGERLSERELEVLRLVAAGCSNHEIAEQLVISVRTVERHITNIYSKIGVRTKAQAAAYAIRHRLS